MCVCLCVCVCQPNLLPTRLISYLLYAHTYVHYILKHYPAWSSLLAPPHPPSSPPPSPEIVLQVSCNVLWFTFISVLCCVVMVLGCIVMKCNVMWCCLLCLLFLFLGGARVGPRWYEILGMVSLYVCYVALCCCMVLCVECSSVLWCEVVVCCCWVRWEALEYRSGCTVLRQCAKSTSNIPTLPRPLQAPNPYM